MVSLKQELKQILIKKQHKLYEKELNAKNLTYDTWIREQEAELKIENFIVPENVKSQINVFQNTAFGGFQKENEGNNSKNAKKPLAITIFDKDNEKKAGFSFLIEDVHTFCTNLDLILDEKNADVILITIYGGKINQITPALIAQKMQHNENIILIYGDEDTCTDNTPEIRINPWFKPDWSPDEFLSHFYFGGLVAVRTQALQNLINSQHFKEKLPQIKSGNDKEILYRILFELLSAHNAFSKRIAEKALPVFHIRQVLFHNFQNGYEQVKGVKLGTHMSFPAIKPIVSIIIPSKDNPQVLFKCLDSLLTVTDGEGSFEIIIVDNGSNESNRSLIGERVEQYNYKAVNNEGISGCFQGLRYLYQPMPFNFSDMCNLGAGQARGNLLLFLNDDMEIIQADWLERLIEKAILPYAGAVGAKLLYPDSYIIQHAGITNLRVGPAHKLQFLSDSQEHYFGKNRGVHDMLAVTGACLMIRKSVFEQVDGFYSGLAVAFNDVDLCYSIYESGYYNIVRNDVVLYHHESLSRGKDGESEEKQLRLQREKDVLYERHQEIYGQDPFYHPYLTNDMLEAEYSPAFHYQVTLDMTWSDAQSCNRDVQKAREDKCLVVGMECAMDIYKWKYGVSPQKGKTKLIPEENGYYFQGYSFVIGADNACYKKKLLLKNQQNNGVFAIPIDNRYRQDIKNNLNDQLNVDLTGFAAKLRSDKLPEGSYQFGMLAEDACSRQKLVNWSNWVLEVKDAH